PPHPGGTADEMLVEAPRPFRSHERLVVEAGWEQRRDERRRRAEVEAERGKAVLALRHEPIIELDHRGAGVGLGTRVAAQAHQRAGLLRPGAQNAARPVVLEAA